MCSRVRISSSVMSSHQHRGLNNSAAAKKPTRARGATSAGNQRRLTDGRGFFFTEREGSERDAGEEDERLFAEENVLRRDERG